MSDDVLPPPASDAGQVDAMWRLFQTTSDWVRFADTKATATLAGSGILGGILIQAALKDGSSAGSGAAVVLAVLAGGFTLASALGSLWCLLPRLSVGEPVSLIYFNHVARKFKDDAKGHQQAIRQLVRTPDDLLNELATQVWANSTVAHTKYIASGVALLLLGIGGVLTAAAAIATKFGG